MGFQPTPSSTGGESGRTSALNPEIRVERLGSPSGDPFGSLPRVGIRRTPSPVSSSLSEATPRLRPSTELRSEGRLTVAWEVYGLGRRKEPLTFRLSLVEVEGSLIRRALKRIGLLDKELALSLSWVEDGSSHPGLLFRAIDVDLPPLEAGGYVLRLEMEIPFRNKVESQRRITVF